MFKNCSYGPYRRILRRIIAEEGFHMRHGEEMLLTFAEGTPIQRELFQEALDRWWLPALHMFGPASKPDDELMRWRIKTERNEVLRDRCVQKYAPLLTGYGFTIPDPDLRHDPETGRWEIGADRLVAVCRRRSTTSAPTAPAGSATPPVTGRTPRGCATRSTRSRRRRRACTDRPDRPI